MLRACVFDAFEPHLPEALAAAAGEDFRLHSEFGSQDNLLLKATVESCTNQGFARAVNLVSPFKPRFDPTLFGKQGKVMDSWESVRHNPLPHDVVVFALSNTATATAPQTQTQTRIASVLVSTEFHDGNHAEFVGVDVKDATGDGQLNV